MAPRGSHLCRSPRWNFSPIDYVEDEFARDQGPINDFRLDGTSFTLFYNPTPGPALVSALIPALIPTPAPALPSFNELFKQFMKAYLESN